jgi:hypothetical protein
LLHRAKGENLIRWIADGILALALTGAAHAANWAADCVGSHNGEHYKIAWHLIGSVTSFYIIPADKPAFSVPLVMENGWAITGLWPAQKSKVAG